MTATAAVDSTDGLTGFLADRPLQETPAKLLSRLVEAGLDRLPLPSQGSTLQRWQALSVIAQHDLSLAKLFEGHTDALAILAELDAIDAAESQAVWGVWAAEPPTHRVICREVGNGRWVLSGRKAWCSGANDVSHALLTAWHEEGRGPQLVAVAMESPEVSTSGGQWCSVGMAGAAALEVAFDQAPCRVVGACGDYLTRPGFWHGGAGVAACWYGGAVALAKALQARACDGGFQDAALGRVDVALQSVGALLRRTAAWIDEHPQADAQREALRVRLAAEQVAAEVLQLCGRALGAYAYCVDARFARMAADLPVFIRQSHGEKDLAALGGLLRGKGEDSWTL